MIKLRAHETDVTVAINGLINEINAETALVVQAFEGVTGALTELGKRLEALEPPTLPGEAAPAEAPDAPIPTL